MYSKENKLLDRREMLKVKVISLADEARTIRRLEAKAKHVIQSELHEHRVKQVRWAARDAHIAYGFVKGRTWKQMEATAKSEPNWKAIIAMVEKYGPNMFNAYGECFGHKAMKPEQARDFCIERGMPAPQELKKAA